MNLYFRLIWTMVRCFFKSRIGFNEKISLRLRILPNDLDINRHLTNGRYLTLLDLASIEYFIRSRVLKKALRSGMRPMLGGALVSYRKGLTLFERCTVTLQWQASDDRWNYFRFEFLNSSGRLCAAGFIKGAFVSRSGIVSNKEASDILGYDLDALEMPEAVAKWIESEKALIREFEVAQNVQSGSKPRRGDAGNHRIT
jgi:acyl-CoA thioesterase FadM